MNCGDEPLKILQECRTRWLSLVEIAVSRIVDQWAELKMRLEMARRTEKCYEAEVLYGMYENQINLGYFLFLRPILTDVQRLTKAAISLHHSSPEDITFVGRKHFLRHEGAIDSSAGSNASAPGINRNVENQWRKIALLRCEALELCRTN
uniref:Zinc finger protein n=1 Tax=Rhipicephalus appendiculatus TaxID=34631 RepID=A0A131YJT0_RHIAP